MQTLQPLQHAITAQQRSDGDDHNRFARLIQRGVDGGDGVGDVAFIELGNRLHGGNDTIVEPGLGVVLLDFLDIRDRPGLCRRRGCCAA